MGQTVAVVWRSSNTIGSRAIRFFTGERFSHVGVVLLGSSVFHSTSKGTHVDSLPAFKKNVTDFHIEYLSVEDDEQVREIHRRALNKIDERYDFWLIVKQAVEMVRRKFGAKPRYFPLKPKTMICTEYAEYILYGTGWALTPGEFFRRVVDGWKPE